MPTKDKTIRYGVVVARVNSRSRPENVYEVRSLEGVLSCNCKGWIYNRERPRRCRHTDVVAASDSEYDYPDYSIQMRRRKEARNIRGGVGQKRDVVSEIVILILQSGGYNEPLPGTLLRMAAVLRPHLQQKDLQVVPDPAFVESKAGDLVDRPTRYITLED